MRKSNPSDLTGRRYGKLTVIVRSPATPRSPYKWVCRCDCGNTTEVIVASLNRGATLSCGCGMHCHNNKTHGGKGSTLYNRWCNMRARTSNPKHISYPAYGGRGITVCERWQSFKNFQEDMGPTFSPELQLERIDNDKGYSPGNCKWATQKEQDFNKRNTNYLEYNGEKRPVREWAAMKGIGAYALLSRIKRGWTIERALTTKARRYG